MNFLLRIASTILNEPIEEANGHIELRAIYNSRNDREENVIETTATSNMSLETAFTALTRPDDLDTYTEGTPNDNFTEAFHRMGYGELDNFVVCKRGLYGGHFISIVKMQERFLLVDGQGSFRFVFYNSLENLLLDLEEFVTGCAFNLHSAKFNGNAVNLQANVSTPSAVKKDKLINDKQVIPQIKVEKEKCAKPKKQAKVNFYKKGSMKF